MAVIVLCSSSSMLRRNLATSLRRFGHDLLETDSSIGLVSACLTRPVSVVIIDSDLEFLSAPDAVRCLRCTPNTRELPVIALGNNVQQLHEALRAGADHGLVKPVELPTFHKLVLHLTQPPVAQTVS
ncbi:MAG TPA: hypothetical protein V6D05_03625 [Stenomitos sp.]